MCGGQSSVGTCPSRYACSGGAAKRNWNRSITRLTPEVARQQCRGGWQFACPPLQLSGLALKVGHVAWPVEAMHMQQVRRQLKAHPYDASIVAYVEDVLDEAVVRAS